VAFEAQRALHPGQVRGAGQRAHRFGAEAAASAAAGDADGSVSGPFCPQPESTDPSSSIAAMANRSGARKPLATLSFNSRSMRRSLMTDLDYARETSALLAHIETTVDRWLQDDVIDIDSARTGGMLELSFPDRSKIIVNTQPPLHEVWLAAKGGGFHYRFDGGHWRDTRDGSEFFAALSQHASTQGARPLRFDPGPSPD
jgi:CyaY protein